MATESAGALSSEESKNNLWSLLPSFDPASDDVREYSQKVRFLHGVCPQSQRGMLAPRLAMLCKGTAWNQVRSIPSAKLTDAETGVQSLLEALSSWEESEEMVTFEKFERALYKIVQKPDESTMSYTNRLNVAFDDLGSDVKVKDVKAFILLRQSCMTSDDKKKVLTMTSGKMDTKLIDQAMRSLATRVLTGGNEPKKKVYPVNFTEEEPADASDSFEPAWNVTNVGHDDEYDEGEWIEQLASQGDSDALVIQTFENDLEDLFQSTPDLQSALISYQEARLKLSERKKFRGFWPTGSRPPFKGGKGKGKKGFMKGSSKGSLLDRISRTHCKLCGERGHWKAECPNKSTKESANVAFSMSAVDDANLESQHVIVESLEDASFQKLSALNLCPEPSKIRENPDLQSALSATIDGSLAVLDTGASRSVIGSDLVPSLLKDLPAEVRAIVKQVMESLKALLFLLVNLAEVHSTMQPVPEERSEQMLQLLSEVRAQKHRIDEIAQILKYSPCRRVTAPETGVDSDLESEVASQTTSVAPSPSVVMTRSHARPARSQAAISVPATSPNVPVMPSPSGPVEHQIVQAVNPSIESWGQKCVSWGKKWAGVRYQEVYERDQGYVQWITDRTNSLTPPMRDFLMYCQSRQRLERTN
eukprot:s1573_g22.t1